MSFSSDDEETHQTEKKELLRLLSTAKDEERKEVIRKAISALDSSYSTKNDKFTPLGSGNYSHLMSNQKIPLDKMKPTHGGAARPLSARARSTSNLEVIHENQSHLAEARRIASTIPIISESCTYLRLSSTDCQSCEKLKVDDVVSIISSSFDPRVPFEKLLPSSDKKNSPKPMLVSSGMLPQFLTITLKENWIIRQIEIAHIAVRKIRLTFGGSGRNRSGRAMMQEEKYFMYSDRSDDTGMVLSKSQDATKSITFTITEADDIFFAIGNIRIFAERQVISVRREHKEDD